LLTSDTDAIADRESPRRRRGRLPAVRTESAPPTTRPAVAIDADSRRHAEHALVTVAIDAHPTRAKHRPERRSIIPFDPHVGKLGIGLGDKEVRRVVTCGPNTVDAEVTDLVERTRHVTSSGAIRRWS